MVTCQLVWLHHVNISFASLYQHYNLLGKLHSMYVTQYFNRYQPITSFSTRPLAQASSPGDF